MNLPESNDPKEALLRKSAMHRHELGGGGKGNFGTNRKDHHQCPDYRGHISSSLFSCSSIFRIFIRRRNQMNRRRKPVQPNQMSDESAEVNSTPGIVSQIGTALASHATVFLLTIAKEKLSEYLKSQIEKGKFNERS